MKRIPFIVIALLAFVLAIGANAATDLWNIGPWSVDSNNVLTPTTSAGAKAIYEYATTSDTLTAVETGKTIIVRAETGLPATFTLPDADVGLNFNFVSATAETIYLTPQTTDSFVGPGSGATNYWGAGEGLSTAGATGDSVEILCAKDLYWYVVNHEGNLVNTE